MAADLKGLVESVAKALADQPDAVQVRESERRGMTVYELNVAPGDLGRVIGRQGRTAAALRTLLSSAAEADGKRVTLDIRDCEFTCRMPGGGSRDGPPMPRRKRAAAPNGTI